MAIIRKNNNSTDSSKDNKDKKPEPKTVDFSDKSLFTKGEKSKLDPTEDAFSRSAPPPKGTYDIQLHLTKDTFKYGYRDEEDENSIWFAAEPECRIVSEDKDIDNFPVYPCNSIKLNTFLRRGKNISTMAAMIKLCGFKLDESMSPGEVAQRFRKVLEQEPILRNCECDWEGWSKDDKKTVVTTMDNVPCDADGNPMHIFTRTNSSGDKEEITCGLRIKVWGSKKGKSEGEKGGNGGKTEKVVKPITVAKEEEEDGEEGEEKVKVAPIGKDKKDKDKDKKKDKPKPEPEEDKEEEEEGVDDLEAAEDDEDE